MKIPNLNFETFGAISAIIVSVAALFVAWDQAVVMRRETHASVWPIMTVDFSVNQTVEFNTVEVVSSNVGVGPAIVKSALLTVGEDQIREWHELSSVLFGVGATHQAQVSASSAIGVMGVDERIQVISVNWERSEEGDAYLAALVQRIFDGSFPNIGLELCYCSVFDRCWLAGRADITYPEPVNRCSDSGDFLDTFFLDSTAFRRSGLQDDSEASE